jgi:hypothetical protein
MDHEFRGRDFVPAEGPSSQTCVVNAESEKDASERILRVIEDSSFDFAMKMKHPERLRVRWEKKRGR